MIDFFDIGLSMIYAGPIVTSLIAVLMVILNWKRAVDHDRRLLYTILISFFFCIAINWIFILFYIFAPVLYTRINIICYLSFLLTHVVLYHFIHVLTRIPGQIPFPKWHFYLVFAIVAVFGIWSLFIPYDVQHSIVISRGQVVPGYELYSRIFTLRIPLKAFYCVVYACLSWRLLLRYRRIVVNYSADTGRTSLGWVNLLLALTLTLIFIPVYTIFTGQAKAVATFTPGASMIPIVIQLVVLCYYTITGNYVIIDPSPDQDSGDAIDESVAYLSGPERIISGKSNVENDAFRHSFEKLIKHQKPYLNPQLRITDLADMLATNRSYISSFINRTYGMNFSRYINRLRIQEMECLSRTQKHEKASLTELAIACGFSSYRSYRKFRLSEEIRSEWSAMN